MAKGKIVGGRCFAAGLGACAAKKERLNEPHACKATVQTTGSPGWTNRTKS